MVGIPADAQERISPPVLRRHEAARGHRHRAGLRTRACSWRTSRRRRWTSPSRRRCWSMMRRPAGKARHVYDPDHAMTSALSAEICDKRCRHVRGRGRRDAARAEDDILRRQSIIRIRRACSARCRISTDETRRLKPIDGLMPDPTQAAGGLQVCAALPALHGAMQDVPAAAERKRQDHSIALPSA